jgi:hypothetical protein
MTPEYVQRLRHDVEEATPRLLALGDASAMTPAGGGWSPKEIVGHLVDSASNNHQRFVRGQFQNDLVFPGYAQDDWVRAGAYRDAPWDELVALWRTFNLQIARVMETAPEAVRLRPHGTHNFDQIGFVPLASREMATLDRLMRDYVDHLEHHLRQIWSVVQTKEQRTKN